MIDQLNISLRVSAERYNNCIRAQLLFVSNCTYDSINLIATSSSEKLIEARQDEFLKVEEPSDSDGLELPPGGLLFLQESHVADQSDDLLPPPGPPPPKAKAMPAVLSNDPGKPPARLAPKPKIKSDDPAAASSSDRVLEPKSPDDPPPGWFPSDTGGKGKSDEVKSDEVGGKSDEVKSDEVGKGQGKSDQGKSDEVGKGQGKSDKVR